MFNNLCVLSMEKKGKKKINVYWSKIFMAHSSKSWFGIIILKFSIFGIFWVNVTSFGIRQFPEIFRDFWKFFERLKLRILWSYTGRFLVKLHKKVLKIMWHIFCTKKLKSFTLRLANSPNRIKSKLKKDEKKCCCALYNWLKIHWCGYKLAKWY